MSNEPFREKVDCKYGAPLGRPGPDRGALVGYKCRLARVPLNSGGYDPGGAYWGIGEPLWCLWYGSGVEVFACYDRAPTREAAKKLFPGTRFYR